MIMKKTTKSKSTAKPLAKDLKPKKSPKGGALMDFKFLKLTSSPPSSLEMQVTSPKIIQ